MFTFRRAETRADLECIHRLRYQVYVVERGFEQPEDHPGGLEKDEFDAHASHFVCEASDGAVVGTIRLILPSGRPFPMERHCEIREPVPDDLLDHVGEISRLAISKSYRRRKGDTIYGLTDDDAGDTQYLDRRQFPVLCLGLLRAGYQESLRHGITFIYAAMEPNLHRLLCAQGIQFLPVGPEVDYHGRRTPHLLRLEELERTLIGGRARWNRTYTYFREGMPEGLTARALVAGRGVAERSGVVAVDGAADARTERGIGAEVS
jgi:N-acyl amino acid synthase of PEP-CTERM/exosortase system